ncbi:MAG TPA: hypothetical protein VFX59_14450 [Polyangiales bacterium]|nr:hypothetical protein [Polyangiales bacterium]
MKKEGNRMPNDSGPTGALANPMANVARQAPRALAVPDVGPAAWRDVADAARSFAARELDEEHALQLLLLADFFVEVARGRG